MHYSNKTAGYHRHVLPLPIFVKRAVKKMKMFFFSKKHAFFIKVPNFSNVQNFLIFFYKKPHIQGGRQFWELKPFDTHSTPNLQPINILKKSQAFFRITHLFFQKRPKLRTFGGISLFQSRQSRQLWQVVILALLAFLVFLAFAFFDFLPVCFLWLLCFFWHF